MSPGEFADGLKAWLAGDDFEGEAAGGLLAETILMHRKWLRAQFK